MPDETGYQTVADMLCKSVVALKQMSITEGTDVEENAVAVVVEGGNNDKLTMSKE